MTVPTPPPTWRARASMLARLIGITVTAWALARELRTPRESRTWYGRLAGFIPYDFRLPSGARVRERLWNPRDPRLVVPSIFGVGWTLNAGRLIAVLRRPSHRAS